MGSYPEPDYRAFGHDADCSVPSGNPNGVGIWVPVDFLEMKT